MISSFSIRCQRKGNIAIDQYILCQSVDELNILLERERAEMKAGQRLALNAAPSVGRVSSNWYSDTESESRRRRRKWRNHKPASQLRTYSKESRRRNQSVSWSRIKQLWDKNKNKNRLNTSIASHCQFTDHITINMIIYTDKILYT